MKRCVKCGHELADEAVFCHICGEKQVQNDNNSENTLHVDNGTPQAVKVKKNKNEIGLGNAMKLITACLCLFIVFGIGSFLYRVYSEQKHSEDIEWSKKSRNGMKWSEAVDYCKNLSENAYSDWRLPTISELRTLIENCPETETGGKCAVTDSCLDGWDCRNAPCKGCYESRDGIYSRFGDTYGLWSSSTDVSYTFGAWFVYFVNGGIANDDKVNTHYVRCVR